jgi:integrase
VSNNRTGDLDNAITPDGVYKLVKRYALGLGLKIGAHALRATAATNALDHDADIAKVQEWLSIARQSSWHLRVNQDGKGSRGIGIMPLMIVAGKLYVSV